MTQNKSPAVMAQRREPHDSLDDFPTPSWGTRALCEHVIGADLCRRSAVWEPACNRGFMARPLKEYFRWAYRSDIFDYSSQELKTPDYDGQDCVHDFLFPTLPKVIEHVGVDWTISNPPFRLAEQFVMRAQEVSRVGVAMLVRTQFLESVGRYARLFSVRPPHQIAQFTERLPIVKGRIDPDISSATAYCWVIWMRGQRGTHFRWIPPCRSQLERQGDYPVSREGTR